MKRFIFSVFTLMLFSASIFAQSYRDVVYLKNGSIIKGDVLEQVAGGEIKIKTADGSLFVYNSSDVLKVVKEEIKGSDTQSSGGNAAAKVTDTEQFRGWRYSPGLGIGVTLGDYSFASGAVDMGVGKDISDQVFLGGGLSLSIPFQENSSVSLGAFFENRIYFPSASSISFVLRDRVNLGANFEHEVFSLGLSVMPGVMMKLSPKLDLLLNAGYQLGINLNGGGAGHNLVFTGTFDIHGAKGGAGKVYPYHSSGLEIGGGFGLGLYKNPDYPDEDADGAPGLCLSVGYRFSPYFSLGVEFAPSERAFYADAGTYHHELFSDIAPFGITARYRIMDKKISPVASLTAGFAAPHGGNEIEERSAFAFLISPKAGVSFRLGSGNGHIEICGGLGAGLTSPFKYNLKDKEPAHIYTMFRPEFTIRYYHTLGLGANWFKEIQFK